MVSPTTICILQYVSPSALQVCLHLKKIKTMKPFKSVLLVEDDSDDQEFFLIALQGIANVTLFGVASNGSEAMARLENATVFPDMVFSDINMPKMNGIEYLNAMAQNPCTEGIPIVMLTSDRSRMDMAMKLGAKGCIEKTPDNYLLRKKLELAIG